MSSRTPRHVRFPAGADLYGPGGRTRIQIDIDESAIDLAGVQGATPGFSPSSSYLEMTITPSTQEAWAATQLRLTEGGANAFIRNIRLMSKQGGVVYDELQDYNLLWDLLFRTGYDDAQRETIALLTGSQNAYEPRSVFNTLPVSSSNASTIAPFTARIPLPTLLGLFRAPAVPLALTKGLTLQIDIETRIPACIVRSAAMPITLPNVTRFTPNAVDKSGGATATLEIGGTTTQADIQAAFDNAHGGAVTNARVVLYNAAAAAITIQDVAYTSTSSATPPVMTFGSNVGGTANIIGGIVEPRGANQYTLAAVNASAGGVKTVTTILDVALADTTIKAGDYVLLVLDAISTATPPVITTTRVEAKITGVAAGGTKLVFTLDDDLPSTNFTGGGYMKLDVNLADVGPVDPGNSTYELTDVAIVAASMPITTLPKMVQWVSFASWPTPLSAGTSSLQWPTLPYSRAMALIARMTTSDTNATTGTSNSVASYEYLLNGEVMVEGGPVPLYQYGPLQRTELMSALEAADIPLRRHSSLVDSLPVALRPAGTAGVDTTMSVVQLKIRSASSAGTVSLYVAHVRTLEGGKSAMPSVEM